MNRFIRKDQIEHMSYSLIKDYFNFIGEEIQIPIPVDEIADLFLELNILYEPIEENNIAIWAGLNPEEKTIIINEIHVEKFNKNIGLYNFTLAHEIGHWELHSNKNENLQFDLFENKKVVFCRDIGINTKRKSNIEIQADMYAAALLMPKSFLFEKITNITQKRKLTYKDLYDLKDEFKVSISALINRVNSLQLAYIEGKNIYSNEEEKNGQISLI